MNSNTDSDASLGSMASLLIFLMQPMLLPCYLFLLLLPLRINTLRNVGIQGRNSQLNSNLMMPFEGFKRLIILLLITLNLVTLFSSGPNQPAGTVTEDEDTSQINSSSQPRRPSENFRAVVELITYAATIALSFMQERRQFVDAWYCQPLLWLCQLIIGITGLQL